MNAKWSTASASLAAFSRGATSLTSPFKRVKKKKRKRKRKGKREKKKRKKQGREGEKSWMNAKKGERNEDESVLRVLR
jgi:hypothetical protein